MKTHKWQDVKYRGRLAKERVEELEREATAEAVALTLRELREALDLTQEQLAELTAMAQSEVSRLERREDWRLSTLRRIVEAMGGRLEVIADFPGRRRVRLA